MLRHTPRNLFSAVALIVLCGVGLPRNLQAQTFQIFFETFDGTGTIFDLNTASGPVGASVGPNTWVINDTYTGGAVYPNTVTQDSTFFGTINGAPTSNYLHIHDSLPSTPNNASFDPTVASDNWAEVNASFCTLGLIDVAFSFFYTVDGSDEDYGEVYYSADGGPWTQIGLSKYKETDQWQFELIEDVAFNDVEELRFGFRWVNDGVGTASTSFSIDDVTLVATYDEISNPVDITISSLSPDPVCQEDNLLLFWEISDPLCEGQYQIELSAPGGGFGGGITGLGVFTIADSDTLGAIFSLPIPGTVTPDTCYRVRISRVAPLPEIDGIASICFEVQDCPNTITTLQPVVTFDTNAVCVNSVIDVPFFSTGAFLSGNNYQAILSNSAGTFDSATSLIGTLPSTMTFDPTAGSPPGTVSGLVPVVEPGCNYWIRVESTNPPTTGSVWGPFCIQECDIETNEIEDIAVCITETSGVTVDVPVGINIFDSLMMYCDTNNFQIEILDPMFFSQVSLGSLGFTISDTDTIITMDIPGYADLLALGLDYGVWYMRIIADCGTDSENFLGTLIHLTIGAPADNASLLIPTDTLVCEGGLATFLVDPYNDDSDYQFQFVPGGTPFIWGFNPILVNLDGFVGDLCLRVREVNFGCAGPWSDTVCVDVLDEPDLTISYDAPVCTGDTVLFQVDFFPETFYSWTNDGGRIVDTANNVIRMVFDSAGTYELGIFGLNICGSGNGTRLVDVLPSTPVNAGNDETICVGTEVNLNAVTAGIFTYTWFAGDTIADMDASLDVIPDSTETFVVLGLNADGCPDLDSVTIFVQYPYEEPTDSTVICPGEEIVLDAGFEGGSYSWDGVPAGQNGQVVTVTEPGGYLVTIDPPDFECPVTKEFIVDPVIDICEAILHVPNAFSPNGDGNNDYFTAYGQAILEYRISIWNRWGELVYLSSDPSEINNGTAGWDGRYKGEIQEVGTYVYEILATGGDGVTVKQVGELFLVR